MAGIFRLSQLQTICSNTLTEQEFLNSSIGTYLNNQTGSTMKKLFFNQPEIADVKFLVEGWLCIAIKKETVLFVWLTAWISLYSFISIRCTSVDKKSSCTNATTF